MKQKEKGFIPVMLTPYLENGEIDFEGLRQLTEFYISAGASGLFANCQSSEMFELSAEESLRVIRAVVEQVDERIPVVAASSVKGNIAVQADFVRQVYSLGVDAVILITGLIAAEDESDAVFEERIFELFELTENIPLGFYECPEPYKRVLHPDQLGRFVASGRIIYHKDTCLDIKQIQSKLAQVKNHDFGLYDAYMVHAVESLKAGAAGLSCIQGNYFPELIVWLCQHCNDPGFSEQMASVQQFLTDNMDVMHHVYPIVAKYFLQKRGLNISLYSRRKAGNFDAQVKLAIDKLYKDYTILAKQLDIPTDIALS